MRETRFYHSPAHWGCSGATNGHWLPITTLANSSARGRLRRRSGDALTILVRIAEDPPAIETGLATKASVWVAGGLQPASGDALTFLLRIAADFFAVIATLATSAKVCWVTGGLQPASGMH